MRRVMKRAALSAVAAAILAACGPSPEPIAPRAGDSAALAKQTVAAIEIEATHPATEAFDAWSRLLEVALTVRGTPLAREASLRAIDGLTGRSVIGLGAFAGELGAMQRVEGGIDRAAKLLDSALATDGARDPIVRRALTLARVRIAAMRGDAAGVAKSIAASGCATEATIVGPFTVPVLGALADIGPLDDGAIAEKYAPWTIGTSAVLALGTGPVRTDGRACTLDTTGTHRGSGLRYVAVDIDVPRAETIAIALTTSLPSVVFANGTKVFSTAYGDIATQATRVGYATTAAAGKVRVIVKLGAYFADGIGLRIFGDDGLPLVAKASAIGPSPTTPIRAVRADEAPEPKGALDTIEARTTLAAGLLSRGEVKLAERAIADIARPSAKPGAPMPPPAASLVYAETIEQVRDLPFHRRLERLRAAYDAVLARWPSSWEPILGRAEVVATQHQGGAGGVEAIEEVRKLEEASDKPSAKEAPPASSAIDPLVDVYLALVGDGVLGFRERALARVMPKLENTFLGTRLARVTTKETEDVREKIECDPKRADLSRWDCAYARLAVGDDKGALDEIARLRTLLGTPKVAIDLEVTALERTRGEAAAKAIYDAADLVDRSIHHAQEMAPAGAAGVDWLRHEVRLQGSDPRVIVEMLAARRASGDASGGPDIAATYDPRTRALIDADRKNPARTDAGTVVLDREERYEIGADGFVHARVWDVRRLGGTADVESNAVARVGGSGAGLGWVATLVHRIFKADGRIVEPDHVDAAQAGAELSQIEPGDYVELVAEGILVARADGAFDLDTPDMLPQRTAVAHATITMSYPTKLAPHIWSHAELGAPATSTTGALTEQTWTMRDHDVRRSEKGQAGLDAAVSVRLSTWSWERLAALAREGALAAQEALPEVTAWVDANVGADRAPTVDLLSRLEKAAKHTLPRVGFLPMTTIVGGPQTFTARTVLLDALGSRVELVRRALDRLGVQSQIVWAEQAPYSADPSMVAKPWRFSHALLVAKVADVAGGPLHDVWLDLDVEGMPPPPGRTSPELRGRSALTESGAIVPVPANAAEEPDTATIDLTVDGTGRGHGSIALLLRGRDAQDLASVLEEMAGEDRENTLRSYVLAWLPGADVTDVKASQQGWQIVLDAKVDVPNVLTPDGGKLAIGGLSPLHSGGRAATIGATYSAQAKRTTALTIRDAIQYTVHRVIRLPKGTTFTTPLPAVDVHDDGTSMRATRKVNVDGDNLVDDLAFSLPTGVVAAKDFATFTASGRTVDDGFASVVRVVPAPGAIKLADGLGAPAAPIKQRKPLMPILLPKTK